MAFLKKAKNFVADKLRGEKFLVYYLSSSTNHKLHDRAYWRKLQRISLRHVNCQNIDQTKYKTNIHKYG